MLGTYTAPKRPFRLEWTDSCRHTQTFATYDAAYKAAREAKPCNIKPCAWVIRRGAGPVLLAGSA